ncbi:MAG: hypothetical protein D6809_02180 [Gammaproteobacteria bacterium]|nr:MAG: hypothetical protein D6809_02180 [Gammaproteobacteria bacterium]
MPLYRVTAFYDRPPVERNVVLRAESPQRAMVRALLEGRVPACFVRDEHGWLVPAPWEPAMGGRLRWPRLAGPWTLVWGEGRRQGRLCFQVEPLPEGEAEEGP